MDAARAFALHTVLPWRDPAGPAAALWFAVVPPISASEFLLCVRFILMIRFRSAPLPAPDCPGRLAAAFACFPGASPAPHHRSDHRDRRRPPPEPGLRRRGQHPPRRCRHDPRGLRTGGARNTALAVDALPDAPATRTGARRRCKKFFDAAMKLAEQRITEGRYVDAETVAQGRSCARSTTPATSPPSRCSSTSKTPSITTRRSGPKFIDRVQQVKDLLTRRRASTTAPATIWPSSVTSRCSSLDPYNNAARKGEERVDLARSARHGDPATATTKRAAVCSAR